MIDAKMELEAKRRLMEVRGVRNITLVVRDPAPAYQCNQALKHDLEENRQKKDRGGWRSREVYGWLERRFRDEFALRLSRSRFDWINSLNRVIGQGLIDHETYYSVGYRDHKSEIIVTQPYAYGDPHGSDVVDIALKLQGVHASLVNLTNWAFYYPGHASCWAIVCTKLTEIVLESGCHLSKPEDIFS